MRNFNFKVNGNEYKANIKSVKESSITVEVNGVPYEVEIEHKEKKTPILTVPKVVNSTLADNMKTSKPGAVQPNAVKAPIPGTVLKVNCRVGDEVKLGDSIILLEAMKMQNEIHASASGTIETISVQEGQAVMEGDTLLTIKS